MSSGKQTSFQYGEVSPRQRYKSNDVAYGNALQALHNMYVRRTGGVSRIFGTKLLDSNSAQDNTSVGANSIQKFKYFSYPTKDVLGRDVLGVISLQLKTVGSNVVTLIVGSTVDLTYKVDNYTDGLSGVKVVYAKGKIFIHGLKGLFGVSTRYVMIEVTSLEKPTHVINTTLSPSIPASILPVNRGSLNPSGNLILIAVQYLITVEFTDGTEIPFAYFKTDPANYNGDSGIITVPFVTSLFINPVEGVTNGFKFTLGFLGSIAPKVKRVNIYRSSISGSASSVGGMVLVSGHAQDMSFVPNPAVLAATYFITINFTDTGASVPSITPPVDFSMFTEWSGLRILEGSSCSALYQERHIIGISTFNQETISPGDIIVSKVGGVSQIARPIISRNTEAFQMSVPVIDGSPVRAIISAEKLVVFTDNATYIFQGGDNGILTPTSINPYRISVEGCSKNVTPIIAKNNVLYLNSSHTKLMSVVFGPQGQAQAVEVGALSDHLLDGEDFIEMAIMSTYDNVVLLLKQNGTLISASIGDENIVGFSTIDMGGGLVETMTNTGSRTKPALLLSVLRNGIRGNETLLEQVSTKPCQKQSFTSCSVVVGSFLQAVEELGYPKSQVRSDTDLVPCVKTFTYINITTATDYNAGTELTLTSITEVFSFLVNGVDQLKVFFEQDSEIRYLYLSNFNAGVFGGGVWTYTCRADIDVPAYLQDVEGNGALTSQEILRRTSRWLHVFNKLTAGFDSGVGIWALYLRLKEGASYSPLVTPDGEVAVDVFADGKVYSAPLNPYLNTLKVFKEPLGVVTLNLPEPVAHLIVGIPYESYMESLPIEPSDERTLTNDNKIINKLGIAVYNTVGGYIGIPGTTVLDMAPIKTRDGVDLSKPDEGLTGYVTTTIPSKWTRDGRIKITQVDPSPMTILSIYPKGLAGD